MKTNIDWELAYTAAVLEADSSKLSEKAHLAEEAIFARLRTLPIGAYGERQAIQRAITALRNLRRERLGNQA
jgi:hypothetical protein